MDSFDSDEYLPTCKCGGKTGFTREREIIEREILTLDPEYGYVEIDDSDLHVQVDWRYECQDCGSTCEDLESLLEFKPIEDESEEE